MIVQSSNRIVKKVHLKTSVQFCCQCRCSFHWCVRCTCLTVAHLLHFFAFPFATFDWPLCEHYLMRWHNACRTNAMQSVCHINANTCTVTAATHPLHKISFCALWGGEKLYVYNSYRVLCYVWISKELRHWFHCKVLAGCLCANRPGLASGQCACHGVASLCIPLYYISSCLRWNISMRDNSQKPNNTFASGRIRARAFFLSSF